MDKAKLYEHYLLEKTKRKVNRNVFYTYLDRLGGYQATIKYLNTPKITGKNTTRTCKVDNLEEIVDYAKVFSVEKAAKEYGVSERTVYRYIAKFNS